MKETTKQTVKKFLLLFIALFTLSFTSLNAQIRYFRTTAFAKAQVVDGTYYWSDWEKSDMRVTVNMNTYVITIYSPSVQVYKVTKAKREYRDTKGGYTYEFAVIDQDQDRGTLRMRTQSDGQGQLYIDFSNIAWVYDITSD